MNEGFMKFDRLLEYKRYCLAGDNGSAIAGSIDDLFQQHGACAAEADSDCDIFVYIVNQPDAGALDEVTKPCCFMTQKALRPMQRQRRGSVIYINPTEAMRAMGYAIAMDVCKFDIRVNFVSHLITDSSKETVGENVERYANAALYLASDMSKNVTGQTLWTHHADFSAADQIRSRCAGTQFHGPVKMLYAEPQCALTDKLVSRLGGQVVLTDDPDQAHTLLFLVSTAILRHISDLREDEFDEIWQTNYIRAHALCLRAAQRMQSGQGGTILLIATDNLTGGARLTAAVSASVGALKDLMLQINRMYDKVRCNIIMAGALANGLTQEYQDLYADQYGAESEAILDGMQLIPKRDDDLDVIDAAIFLLSDQSSSVTGQCIPVNGGIRTLAHANMIYYFKAR